MRRSKRLFAIVVLFALGLGLSAAAMQSALSEPLTSLQRQLKAQVDTPQGAPQNGKDPANQPQTSLKAAATQHVGNGTRTDKPAAAVKGANKRVDPASVLGDRKKDGRTSGGCLLSGPKPGDRCVTRK